MKKLHATFVLSLGLITAGSVFSQGPAIPNASFETWVNQGQYSDPENWKSINSETVSFVSTIPVTQTSDAHSGMSAARLETINALIATSPGAMSLGRIVQTGITDRDIRGGIPCTERPTSLEGYYKFSPVQNDRGYIGCILFKYNTVTNQQDTVGRGVFKPNSAVGAYTFFTVDIEYLTAETPDTMNIIVTSSYKFGSPKVGTLLFVDDLKVNYDDASISKLNEVDFSISPNPSSGIFTVSNASGKELKYEVYDVSGKLLFTKNSSQFEEALQLTDYPKGIYMLKLEVDNQVVSKRLVIE
jgi:hypothetical protein